MPSPRLKRRFPIGCFAKFWDFLGGLGRDTPCVGSSCILDLQYRYAGFRRGLFPGTLDLKLTPNQAYSKSSEPSGLRNTLEGRGGLSKDTERGLGLGSPKS